MSRLGIYEKATPKHLDWKERLLFAKSLGFSFVEMSIDETDERLARLDWGAKDIRFVQEAIQETGVQIYSICLSGHRRYPLGSADPQKRTKALEMMQKAVNLAEAIGVRNIQLAGYDVYYEEKTVATRARFIENLKKCVAMAEEKQVMLSIEIMDDPFINSITKFKKIKNQIPSPWLQVYPDIGNLSAWPENDQGYELELGRDNIVAVHLKDTKNVTENFEGQFKNVPFGEGDVDFLGCLKTLKSIDYHGTFLIEMWSEASENPEAEIRKALDFLMPLLKEAGYEF